MRALFRAITYVLRSWLNSLRGRPAAGRVESQLGGDHIGGTPQKDGAGLEADDAQTRDEAPEVANVGEPEPPHTTAMDAADPQPLSGEADRHDILSGTHDEDGEDTTGDEARPCPRCGVTCPPDEVERVFGSRTMRWSAAGTETTAVRRQSYCRQCRAEQAAEMRGRQQPSDRSGEEGPVDHRLVPTDGEQTQLTEVAEMFVTPHEAIGTDDEQQQEPAGHVAKDSAAAEIGDVLSTDKPNNLAGNAQDKTRTSTGEAENVSNPQAVDSPLTDSAGTNGESDPEAERPVEESKPRPDGNRVVPSTSTPKQERRHPALYRAPTGGPPPQRQPSQSRTTDGNTRASPTRGQLAAIEVRVLFLRGGCCSVSLLPKRPPGFSEEPVVSSRGGEVKLQALQDDWYQDVTPDNLAELLSTGFVWTDAGAGQEWALSGREVFVLAQGTTHRGFVSCPRLALGRDHVVLCTVTRLSAVADALREAGCAGWTQLREDNGAPTGWLVLREIVPQRSVAPSSAADILNILRPLPEVEISLEGGIRLGYNSWLLGHPPAIQVYGHAELSESVLIDGQEAVRSEQDGYAVPGRDDEGYHQVSCGSTSKSYSLVHGQTNWKYWPAYSFSLRGTLGKSHEFEFCGPLAHPVALNNQPVQQQVVQVPPANPVLLGAHPGEVLFAHRRLEVRGAQCLGLPPFEPMWALPAQPLNCDKRTNRILLVGRLTAEGRDISRQPARGRRDLERWCQLVLDASRKGLVVEPNSPETHGLWREYNHVARSLWRRLR